MSDEFPERLEVDGRTLPMQVVRKRVKHLNARLRGGRLLVSAPLRASRRWVVQSLPELARSLLRREGARDLARDGRALAAARRVARRFPRTPDVRQVEFTARQTACWGTYQPADGTIRVSAVLRHMPVGALESVIAHELCHAFYRSHGPRFRALLARVQPDIERWEGFLDGAQWMARCGDDLPPGERGPLQRDAPVPAPSSEAPARPSPEPEVVPGCFRRGLLFDLD